MKKIKKLLYIVLGTLLSLVLLLTSVDIVTFNINHYIGEYEKHDIPEVTGMNMENLEHVTTELLSYLKEERDDLNIRAIVRGEEREVFGEKEKLHMVDVKDLFIEGRWIRNIGLLSILVLMILLIKKDRLVRKNLSKTFMYTAMINIDLIIILFLLMYFNFNKYFDYFHYIFFDNDLWLLDPNTEILIQMLPQEFFYNTAVKIAGIYIGSIATLGLGGFWYHKKNKTPKL